jgi:HEAT repeat protein
MNIKIIYVKLGKVFLISFFLFLNSCALLLITEPDEQAKRYQSKNDGSELPCGSFKRSSIDNNNHIANGKCENEKPFVRAMLKDQSSTKVSKIDFYIEQLNSNSDVVRTGAVTQLGMLGVFSMPAVPRLEYLALNDSSKWVRRSCIKSLQKIGSSTSLSIYKKALKDSDTYVKSSAKNALSLSTSPRARLR